MIPTPDTTPRRGALAWLGATARDWSSSEGERLIFIAKTMLAGFTALWLAYRLGLDSPSSSITTVFILALPSSGMVLEKAAYRMLGTIVGSIASLTLIALFPQQTVLLFVGLALWIGACTCGAALYRNAQSYSFVLAGYTACIILIPAIEHPTAVFLTAVTRVSEVGLGILCSAVVNDALLPRHHSARVMRTVQARYSRFIGFCHDVLEQKLTPAQVELAQLGFAADIAALESGRASAAFEATHARQDTRALHAFNSAFMATLTTFYTTHRLLQRLREEARTPVLALVQPLYLQLAGAVRDDSSGARLESMRAQLQQQAAAARHALVAGGAARPQLIDFDTAVELLDRYAGNLHAFQALYHGLTQQKRQQLSEPQAYEPKTPPLLVLASGARAATAVLLLAGAWYQLAWPDAVNTFLMATVFCALASSSPRPNALVSQVLTGFCYALPLAFINVFFVLVHASGFPMLVLTMLPLLVLASYLITDPKRLGIGLGMALFTCQLVTPLNLLHLDAAVFLNTAISLIFGVALAYVIFAVLLPGYTSGQKDHVARALWREARRACVAAPRNLKHRFGSRVRDLLSQLNAAAGPAPDDATRAVVRLALTLLELGHSVIDMRALIAASQVGPARSALQQCVDRIGAYLAQPTTARCQGALDAIFQAGPAVRLALAEAESKGEAARVQRLQAALTDLHAIHTSLQDQLRHQLPPLSQGPSHAA